jgi:exonuclease III
LTEKSHNLTRIYSQNVNGIQLEDDGGQFKEICTIHQEVQADITCIQEHNLDTTQYKVTKIIRETAQKHCQRARTNIASSPVHFSGTWKPGGTAIMSTGSITGRITATGTDNWGRWSYQTFQGHNRLLVVTFITVYQVVEKFAPDKGQFTAAAQQRSLLLRQGDVITDPRQAFQRDLHRFLTQLQQHKHEILLLGDFNERLGDKPHETAHIAATFDLTDIFRIQHPHLLDPATYIRGHKRLDFALGSARVAQAVHSCGYEAFNYRFHTDHRAYFIDFDTEALFGSATQQLVHHTTRILHSNNVKQVTQYIREKHQLLSNHNAFARADKLSNPGVRHQYAERLDADVLRASLIAEHRIHRYKDPPWSIELANARKKVSILSKALTMAKTGLDHTSTSSKTQWILSEKNSMCQPRRLNAPRH